MATSKQSFPAMEHSNFGSPTESSRIAAALMLDEFVPAAERTANTAKLEEEVSKLNVARHEGGSCESWSMAESEMASGQALRGF